MNANTATAQIDIGERDFISSIYGLLAMGFVVSGISAFFIMSSSLYDMMFNEEGLSGLGYLVTFAPLGLLLLQAFSIIPTTGKANKIVFWLFVTLKGFILAYLTDIFPPEAILQAMAITAVAFGGISLYAYTTKKDLSGLISFLMIALLGIIVTLILNIFIKSPMIYSLVSFLSVLVFGGFIAWETQTMKNAYHMLRGDKEEKEDLRYAMALSLYISIFGLFRSLLNLSSTR